jgi:tryptophan-rich sensory protein
MKKGVNWKVLIISLLVVYAVAAIGGLLTTSAVNSSWYEQIKPSITPPNWIFPVVWNVLFFLIALSLYFAWMSAKAKEKGGIALIFGLNLALNVLWSYFYFYSQKPSWAFFELMLLWLSTALMIYTTWKINKKSAWLLVPYLVWLSFAGVLNYLSAFA